jgi:UDP-2-acetamido-3-amino-2,3-dideoxy-glucuronate N-acetyltransferase
MREVFIHERALCESEEVGAGTMISAFAHVHPGARVGADCSIWDAVQVEEGAVLGDRVTLRSGVSLWRGVRLDDDVFVGANATFTTDPVLRGEADGDHPETVVHAGASVGANATILPGIEIGRGAVVGAGAVVTRSVPPYAIVFGNPAQIQGYLETQAAEETAQPTAPSQPGITGLPVRGAHVQRFVKFSDFRGSLTAGEMPSEYVPFAPHRWFLVYDVPSRELRGEHAHRTCHQFLVCIRGSVRVSVDDGEHRSEVLLDSPTIGIYIPPMVWGSQFRHEGDSMLLVLASHPYDPSDYIREYETFLAEIGSLGRR